MVLPALLITFREGIEAALIIAIIVAYLVKVKRPELKKYAWLGTASAIGASAGVGAIVLVTFGTLEGAAEQLFEGTASILATVVLTTMIIWMARNAKRVRNDLHEKIDFSISKKHLAGIAIVSFIAVFKEGIETVLFLTAIYASTGPGTLIGFGIGIAASVLFSLLLFKGSVKLPISKFFKYSSLLLIVFAAGLFGTGIHEYIEAAESFGMEPGMADIKVYDVNPASEDNWFHENGAVGSIFKALLGYDGNPEALRVIGYLGYWLIVGGYFVATYNRPVIEKPIKAQTEAYPVKG